MLVERGTEAGHSQPATVESNHRPAGPPAEPVRESWYLRVKVVVDFFLALAMIFIAAPVVLLAVIFVKLTSHGPAFYSQTRLGRHGRTYTIHKIRTMVNNCESATGPLWATPFDPRITPIGRFLRRSHIDELPQLMNVLRGEMSLVGPRPERPEFLPRLEQAIHYYRDRLLVRPGMTGLAQVQLPPDTDLASVRRKLAYDLYYVRRIGPWLDLQILISTACYLLHIPFRMQQKLFRVPGGETVEPFYENLTATCSPRVPMHAARAERNGTLGHASDRNPKSEARNPKQMQNPKSE